MGHYTADTVGQDIEISIAGPTAQEFWFSGTMWQPGKNRSIGDGGDLLRIARRIDLDGPAFRAAQQAVFHVVRTHWPVVCSITSLLLERRYVMGADLEEFVQRELLRLKYSANTQ